MTHSTNRILTTHVGALQRPGELTQVLVASKHDPTAATEPLREAVGEVVRHQAEVGVASDDDGEYGKSIWQWYGRWRMAQPSPRSGCGVAQERACVDTLPSRSARSSSMSSHPAPSLGQSSGASSSCGTWSRRKRSRRPAASRGATAPGVASRPSRPAGHT